MRNLVVMASLPVISSIVLKGALCLVCSTSSGGVNKKLISWQLKKNLL